MHQLDMRTFVRNAGPAGKIKISRNVRKNMTDVEEIWATYCDVYEVSNLGNVRNKDDKQYRHINYNPKNNYASVSLKVNGEHCNHYVHRIVAIAFNLPRREDQTCIDHMDDDPKNNRLENLQWVTHAENNAKRRPRKTNTGHPHISKRTQTKKGKKEEKIYYYFTFNYKGHNKTYCTLEAAIAARDAYLTSRPQN